MSDHNYIGVNYGDIWTNRDPETGIRFSCISQHSLSPYAVDDLEADYGDPACPSCGGPVVEYDEEKHGQWSGYGGSGWRSYFCNEYACEACAKVLDSDDVYSDEPLRHRIDETGYQGYLDSQGDVILEKSPYFTYAQYCSPCMPGGCHLDNPRTPGSGAARCYAFGADWFENHTPPYDIYEVATGRLIHLDGHDQALTGEEQ
jgi:hypothetical protein